MAGLLQFFHKSDEARPNGARRRAIGRLPAAAPAWQAVPSLYRGTPDFSPFFEVIAMVRALRIASLLGLGAMALAGCGHKQERPQADLAASKVTAIGVNGYLWRAALDTFAFMPLASSDSNGGVIVTDWYANPATPNERMRVTVTILDQDLRADALRIAAARQVNQNGQWVDAPVQAATVQKLEEIVLNKARELRRAAVAG